MKFEIHKTLILSTGHVTRETAKLLEGGNVSGHMADWSTYGWVIWAKADNHGGPQHHAIPDDLQHTLDFARALDCEYLRLDSDGPRIDFLPYWEW
jgi:hypothetical protein